MNLDELLAGLRGKLQADDSRQVFAALRQDPLVWQSLEQPDFLKMLLGRAGDQAAFWSPGQLALLAIGDLRPAESIRADPLAPLHPMLQEKAVQQYQKTQRTGRAPASLCEAGLLALALRERRRLTGSWNGLLGELLPRQKSPDRSSTSQ